MIDLNNLNCTGDWPNLDPNDRRLKIIKDKTKKGLEPKSAHISTPCSDVFDGPENEAKLDAQILHGETIKIYAEKNNRLQIQSDRDQYVGWVNAKDISYGPKNPTHWVSVPRTFLYANADMKSPRKGHRSMGSSVCVVDDVDTRGTKYALLDNGKAMIASHLVPVDKFVSDFVTVAEKLIHTPYLWGGGSAFGLDCSGFVQLSMRMAGIDVLRDSDMQAATNGQVIDPGEKWQNLQRGDLIFWPGHIAIVQGVIDDQMHIIHANGHTMDVTSEPLFAALERIAYLYQNPIGVRRPDNLSAC